MLENVNMVKVLNVLTFITCVYESFTLRYSQNFNYST